MSRKSQEKGPRFNLSRIPLDRQGYTKGKYPRYYGVGPALFSLEDEDGEQVSGFAREFRAADRAAAVSMIRAKYPNARFR